jgi:Zn-dependent protease
VIFGNPEQFIINSLFLIPALLVGLVLHEYAHARVAVARGDQTPRIDGRLSLDPSHHLDPLGTIAIFLIHFGWAKPVRINPYRMRSRFDPALVALAGPLTNLLIAIALSIPMRLALSSGSLGVTCPEGGVCVAPITLAQPLLLVLFVLVLVAFYLNVVLAVFNLLPIPPLDGYNFVATLLRPRFPKFFIRVDMNRQVIVLVFVLIILVGPYFGLGLGRLITPVYEPLSRLLLGSVIYPIF